MTEFDENLDTLVTGLTERDPIWFECAWPKEQVVIDTYNSIGFVEGEGLYSFWSADVKQSRIIRAFRKIGAVRLADLLQESRWARRLIKTTGYEEREQVFGAEQFHQFSEIEAQIMKEFGAALPLIRIYVAKHSIEVKPLGFLGKCCGLDYWYIWVPSDILARVLWCSETNQGLTKRG